MLLRIADQLGRGVKPHRLAVDQGRRERRRVVVFQPGRNVHQQGETGRVGLGEPVLAKAANLPEHLIREFFGESSGAHAVEQLGAKPIDHAWSSPRAHRPPQAGPLHRV